MSIQASYDRKSLKMEVG